MDPIWLLVSAKFRSDKLIRIFSYSLLTRDKDAVQQLGPNTDQIIAGDLIAAGSDTAATGLAVNCLPMISALILMPINF